MNKDAKSGPNTLSIIIAYFLIYVVWGSTYYFIGEALKDFPPFLLGGIRFSTAALLLFVWCFLKGKPILQKSLILKSAVSGIVLLFVDMAVIMLAQQYLQSSLVAIIAASTAIWITVLDVPMWNKNFKQPLTVMGLVLGFGGVVMLFLEQFFYANSLDINSTYGFVILVFGCISWSLGTLFTKYKSLSSTGNALSGSAWQMLFAGVVFWICSVSVEDISGLDFKQISSGSWFAMSYLIVLGSVLAYSSYIWLLKVRPATEVATHAYVNPFIAVFIGFFLGSEHITLIQILGLVTILVSVMLINKRVPKLE